MTKAVVRSLVAHDCGYPLSRYTCRATRVAADLLDFIAFCRCSTGVAPHTLKILVSHLSSPPFPGGVAPKFGSEKVSRYTGVSQLQLRVSRYTVQLRCEEKDEEVNVGCMGRICVCPRNKLCADLGSCLVTQRFCYRGPKPQKCPKWLGEGAKGLLGQGRQRPLALAQKRVWADPGVLWKKAPRAMRAMRGKTFETVPFQPYFGCTKSFLKVLSNSTAKQREL